MKIIAGNWKMFVDSFRDGEEIVRAAKKEALRGGTRVIVCPPFPLIPHVVRLAGKSIAVGGQTMSPEEKGAWTGDVSAGLLKESGARVVILGHSECRARGETDADIARKVTLAVKAGFSVILCVGEKSRDGDEGGYYAEVRDQLLASLAGVSSRAAAHLMIAYEPVWAIGTQAIRAASPQDCREMVVFIRKHLSTLFGQRAAFRVPVLYGGSADDRNAVSFLTEGSADGLLLGRASTIPERFASIIRLAHSLL